MKETKLSGTDFSACGHKLLPDFTTGKVGHQIKMPAILIRPKNTEIIVHIFEQVRISHTSGVPLVI